MNLLLFILAIVVFMIGAVYFSSRRMKKACEHITDDLKRKQAADPASAIDLPYCKRQLLHFGLRDYHPDALQFLVRHDCVRVSEEGKFYLGKPLKQAGTGEAGSQPQA